MNRAVKFSAMLCMAAMLATMTGVAQTATLKIDAAKVRGQGQPTLYGLMTEEINYSYEGGLYAELVRNRTFRSDWEGIEDWIATPYGSASGKVALDKTTGPSTAIPNQPKGDGE